MECYYCDAEAVQECARCGALYCDSHGDALCQRCLDPALALPSYRVYRGSLLALLVGTVFAVWLLVRPPATSDADAPVPPSISSVLSTPTPGASEGGTTGPAEQLAGAPVDTSAPAATSTPPVPTPTAAPPVEHTVAAGDTLTGIAARYVPPGKSIDQFVSEIQAANGISNAGSITAGQVLRIPR
jgi:LysM repeat protein